MENDAVVWRCRNYVKFFGSATDHEKRADILSLYLALSKLCVQALLERQVRGRASPAACGRCGKSANPNLV